MNFKNKLKTRLYYGIICIVLGVIMIIGVTATKSENEYVSAFGFALAMVGAARIIQYLKITKDEDSIKKFTEKSKEDGGWINAGFMVLNPEVFGYLDESEDLIFERGPLETLAKQGQLMAYKHKGFWQCMDTLRDQIILEGLVENKKAPWIKWEM